eukprot:333801-Chlamydomonas_euryale.AAC.3
MHHSGPRHDCVDGWTEAGRSVAELLGVCACAVRASLRSGKERKALGCGVSVRFHAVQVQPVLSQICALRAPRHKCSFKAPRLSHEETRVSADSADPTGRLPPPRPQPPPSTFADTIPQVWLHAARFVALNLVWGGGPTHVSLRCWQIANRGPCAQGQSQSCRAQTGYPGRAQTGYPGRTQTGHPGRTQTGCPGRTRPWEQVRRNKGGWRHEKING